MATAAVVKKKKRRQRGTGGIYQRNGSKNWLLRYRNVDGSLIQESSGTEDYQQALSQLKSKKAQVELGHYVEPKAQNVTVKYLYESFLTAAKAGLTKYGQRHGSYRDTRMIELRWTKHLKPVVGNLMAIHVNKKLLEKYVEKRQEEGASVASVNREISILRAAFYHNEELIGKMPKFPMRREDNVRKGFLEDMQYQALADACGRTGLWLRAMFEVAYRLGWRSGGLKQMKKSQFDAFNSSITLTAEQSKNGEEVTVCIPTGGILYKLLTACASGKEAEDYLFSRGAHHKPISDFRESWANACEQAGVPGLLFHDLRRTAVSNMEALGITRSVAMSITGHKTESVYRRYDINDQRRNAQVSAMEKVEGRRLQLPPPEKRVAGRLTA